MMARQVLSVRPEFSPLSIVRALWRRKWLILALSLVGSAATVAGVHGLRPVYQAEAVILVESQAIPEHFVAATVQTALEARLDALKQQVLSRDLLWGLVETLGLYREERRKLTKEEVLEIMRRDISIRLERGWSARGPGAFRVEYRAPKPEIAAEVANRVGMFFINENVRQRTVEADGTSEFLNGQLAAAEKRLREQETKLKEFKLAHNGELPQQEAALLAAMNQSRTELLGIQDSLSRAQQNKLILESSLAYAVSSLRELQESVRRQTERSASTPAEVRVPGLPATPTELERAQSQLRSLRDRYHDSHPEVQQMTLEVKRLEREASLQAARAPQSAPGSGGTNAAAELAAIRAQEDALRAANTRIQELRSQISAVAGDIRVLESRRQRILDETADSQTRIRNIPIHEQELAALTRDYETCKTNYDSLLNKKLAADIAADMERREKSQRFVMLDPARVPQRPVRPRRTLLTAAGTMFSFLAAAALGFLLELRKGALLGEWELPADTFVLGRIPRMEIESL